MLEIDLQTKARNEFVDLTHQVQAVVASTGIMNGLCTVFVPHTTAGVTINEGADPSVRRDILVALERVSPKRGDYHHAEGNSDAHIKSTLVGCDRHIPVKDGQLLLGTWQAIYFCEFDGPRRRRFYVSVIPA